MLGLFGLARGSSGFFFSDCAPSWVPDQVPINALL